MAFIWDKRTGMQDLGPPNTIESLACDLNDSGEVVGFLSAMRSNQWYAFRWDPNAGMQNLGITESGMTHTCHTNNQRRIVGIFGADDHTTVSMWTREGGMQKAPCFKGTFARVVGLNDANHFIVCMDRSELRMRRFAVLPHTVSYICDPNGGFKNIANCLGRKGVVEFVARGFNNKGQIIGLLMLEKQSNALAVVLEPVQ
jgi:probable HAF family extracellular repeat protein